MKWSKNCAIGLIVLGVVAMISLFGCASPLNTEGVRRITPRGEAWSHVIGISWSPDGAELALTWVMGGPDLRPEGYVYVIDVEGRNPRILTHTRVDGEVADPAWSPISNQIAFYSSGWDPGGIWLVDTGGEEAPRFLGEGKDCAWSPDGEEIAIANSKGGDYVIYILNTRTSERRRVFQLSEEGKYVLARGISWLSTGDRLAFSFGLYSQDRSTPTIIDIYEMDLTSGESHLLAQGGQNEYPSWSPDGTMIAFSGGEWREQTLVIMRVSDGSVIRPLNIVGIGPVAWSPNGNLIAFEWRGSVYAIDTTVALAEWW